MVKQTYRWVLGLGILLVLIGVGVFVQVKSAHDTRLLRQNLRVAEAVNQLDGCVTCHEVTNQSPLVQPNLLQPIHRSLCLSRSLKAEEEPRSNRAWQTPGSGY
jgi:hypothetical protein